MKKVLMACLAVAVLFAIASTATAVTCTLDQRPGATLLVPYFQVSVNSSGNPIGTGALSRDTIVTIGNASSAPMIAHVNVYDRYSTLQLDFNVALTGFDLQSWSMSNILSGNLPITVNAKGGDACQSNPLAFVYPSSDGFIRVRPDSPATSLDNTAGITKYGSPAFSFPLGKTLATECDGTVDPLAIGYIVIDHANYCTLSDPTDPNYYYNNAIGMENNLFGEIIFTSGNGLPTYGISTVNLEADSAIGIASNVTPIITPARTFYARYWAGAAYPATICPNCVSVVPGHNLGTNSAWNVPGIYPNVVGIGDQREPLGLRWALRWFDLTSSGIITTNFQVWRGSRTVQSRAAFCSKALPVEPPVALTFWDEDELTVQTGGCPSPCTSPVFNFDVETQQRNISDYQHPAADAGWVQVDFLNLTDGDKLDQAWAGYAFEGSIALESVLIQGTQLDPSTCNPLGVVTGPGGVQDITPRISIIPTGTGQ